MNFLSSLLTKHFAVLIFIFFLLACRSITDTISPSNQAVAPSNQPSPKSNQTTSSTPDANDAGKVNLLDSEKDMQTFTADLKKAVGSDNPNILELVIYDEYALVQVQDPNKPENVDSYTFRDNKLSDPAPVKLMGNGSLKDNVFPLNEVDLSKIPALSKEIGDKLKDVEGGKLNAYSIGRGLPFTKDVRMIVLTSATRKNVTAQADAKGKLTKFEVK